MLRYESSKESWGESTSAAIHEHAENISKKQQKDIRRKEQRERRSKKRRNGILIPSNGDPSQISIFLLSYRTFVTVVVVVMVVTVVVVTMVEGEDREKRIENKIYFYDLKPV